MPLGSSSPPYRLPALPGYQLTSEPVAQAGHLARVSDRPEVALALQLLEGIEASAPFLLQFNLLYLCRGSKALGVRAESPASTHPPQPGT